MTTARRTTSRLLAVVVFFRLVLFFAPCQGVALHHFGVSSDELSESMTEYACEGDLLNLTCPIDHVIRVMIANYGRFSVNVCNEQGIEYPNTQCHYEKSTWIMSTRCDARQTCQVVAADHVFQDMCPETFKYLEATFTCVRVHAQSEPVTTAEPTITTTTTSMDTVETAMGTFAVPVVGFTAMSSFGKSLLRISADQTPPASVDVEGSKSRFYELEVVSKFCPEVRHRGIIWPETESGHLSRMPCPNNLDAYAEWPCGFDGSWIGAMPNLSRCVSPWLLDIEKSVSSSSSLEERVQIASELQNRTRRSVLYGTDVSAVTSLMNDLVQIDLNESTMFDKHRKEKQRALKEMFKYMVETGSNILQGGQIQAWTDLDAANRLRSACLLIEAVGKNAELVAEAFRNRVITESHISKHIVSEVNVVEVQGRTQFMTMQLYEAKLDSATIPTEALRSHASKGRSTVVFSMFENLGVYMHAAASVDAGEKSEEIKERRVVSNVVSISINAAEVNVLSNPVVITFHTKQEENLSNPQCVYLHKVPSSWRWSSDGCRVVSHNQTHTSCACDHLSTFAVLMDVYGVILEEEDRFALDVISRVGCIVSIVCLVTSIVSFCMFRVIQCERNTIHKNLCLCLLLAELVFLIGISETRQRIVCGLIAGSLHYLFLAAFAWMLLEGFQLYTLLVEVFEPETNRKKFYYLFGYGMPLVIVAASVGVGYRSYGTKDYCWLNTENYFVFSFVGPVIFVLAANMVFLIIALVIVYRHTSYSPTYYQRHKDSYINYIRFWIKGAFITVFLLGLTWAFGLFYVSSNTVIMAYVFTLLNSLQGLFIFVFHVAFNDKIRKEWARLLSRGRWSSDWSKASDAVNKPVDLLKHAPKTSTMQSFSSCSVFGPMIHRHDCFIAPCGEVCSGLRATQNAFDPLLKEATKTFENSEGRYDYAIYSAYQPSVLPPQCCFLKIRSPPRFSPPPPPPDNGLQDQSDLLQLEEGLLVRSGGLTRPCPQCIGASRTCQNPKDTERTVCDEPDSGYSGSNVLNCHCTRCGAMPQQCYSGQTSFVGQPLRNDDDFVAGVTVPRCNEMRRLHPCYCHHRSRRPRGGKEFSYEVPKSAPQSPDNTRAFEVMQPFGVAVDPQLCRDADRMLLVPESQLV